MSQPYNSKFNQQLAQAREIFPYEEWNHAQLKIIQSILSLENHDALLLESPTGSGKTIASMTAMLARRKPNQKIIIFTRTISQMEPILREWGRIYSYEDINLDRAPLIVPILGKARMCKQLPIIRKSAKGYSDMPGESVHLLCKSLPCKLHPDNDTTGLYQIRNALGKLKKICMKISGSAKTRSPPIDDIVNLLLSQPSCGYYSLKSMLKFATIVVATFPYMRDPLLKSVLKSLEVPLEDVMILVDEAHNLVTTKETSISYSEIETVEQLIGKFGIIKQLKKAMTVKKQISPLEIASDFEYNNVIKTLTECDPDMRNELRIDLPLLVQPEVINFVQFLRARYMGRLFTSKDQLRIVEPTPANVLQELNGSTLQIYQSGTFSPIHIYKTTFGLSDAKHLIIKPMREENRFLSYLTWKGMTSKYNRRGKVQYTNMAQTIMYLGRITPRHMLVVCPSYEFIESLKPILDKMNASNEKYGFQIVYETKNIDIKKLTYRVSHTNEPLIMVGVSSGKISEGVEYVVEGKSVLSTVVFAGLPYRPMSEDDIIIRNIISRIASDSQMVKQLEQSIPIERAVRQAFGRTIRSDDDRGALIILDFRAEEMLRNSMKLKEYGHVNELLLDLYEFFQDYDKIK